VHGPDSSRGRCDPWKTPTESEERGQRVGRISAPLASAGGEAGELYLEGRQPAERPYHRSVGLAALCLVVHSFATPPPLRSVARMGQ
jgi:hypothetical protein